MSNIEQIYYMLQENDCGHWFIDNADTLKLAEYLDKKGCIVPPCKVGQTVYVDPKTWRSAYLWVNYPYTFIKEKHYIVADVVAIVKTRKQTLVKLGTYNQTNFTREYKRYPISAIGKTVFLTREEAEKALTCQKSRQVEKGGDKQ